MAGHTAYYSVRADGAVWSVDCITISDFEQRGYKVQPSRLIGDFDVFRDGFMVANLFGTKAEAAQHIKPAGRA